MQKNHKMRLFHLALQER